MFFAEPGTINIDTNLDSFISSAKITGSKNQELYEEYKKINSRFRDENQTLIEQKFKALKNELPIPAKTGLSFTSFGNLK